MDPLRFGAGEAEAFHPLVKLRKHTSYQHLRPAFPKYHLTVGTRRRLGSLRCCCGRRFVWRNGG